MNCFLMHRWGKWVAYELEAVHAVYGHYCQVRQRRQCERCGMHKDVLVKPGPMWPNSATVTNIKAAK